MIVVRNKYLERDALGEEREPGKITEVYSRPIPKMNCVRGWFVRDLVETDFGEEFEDMTPEGEKEREVGKGNRKRTVCYREGNFSFAPEVRVVVYEDKGFTRVYLKYDDSVDEWEVGDVREVLNNSGLVRKIFGKKK